MCYRAHSLEPVSMAVKETLLVRANDRQHLLQKLKAINVEVPPRDSGKRKSEHAELYCIRKLIHFLCCSDRLSYPLALWHRDKPDFRLELPGNAIGIEHTEAVPEKQVRKDLLRSGRSADSGGGRQREDREWHFVEKHTYGEEKRDNKVLRKELTRDPHNKNAPGYAGDECEIAWAEVMKNVIKSKKVKLEHYQQNQASWLLVYGNWYFPCLEIQPAMRYLKEAILEEPQVCEFDEVWILEGDYVCRLHDRAAGEVHEFPQL
jgi:hypothetical protein